MKPFIPILIFLLLSANSFAQQKVDSLKLVLGSTFETEKIIDVYTQLSVLYELQDVDSSLDYASKAYAKSLDFKSEYLIGISAANLADLYIRKDLLDTAIFLYHQAVENLSQTDSLFDLAQSYLILGNLHLEIGKFDNAFESFHAGLKIAENKEYKEVLAHLYNNIGVAYIRLEDNSKALDYFTLALSLFGELDWEFERAHTLSNMALIQQGMGELDLAKINLNESLRIYGFLEAHASIAHCLINLGNIEFDQGSVNEALGIYNEALTNLFVDNNPIYLGPKQSLIASSYLKIGVCYIALQDYINAETFLIKGTNIADSSGLVSYQMDGNFHLSSLFEERKEFAKSLKHHKAYKQFADSMYSDNSMKNITQLEMQYEFDRKNRERELQQALLDKRQQRKDFVLLLTVISILALAVIFILLFLNQRNKNRQEHLKQAQLKQELEHKNKELTTNVMYLLKKNEFITKIGSQLTRLKYDLKKENQKVIQEIIRELEGNISDESWNEFEVRFMEVHSDFYQKLNSRYTDLSPNERKLCAFLRLNMTTKEISAITYQSVSSINMARFRLRKKMGIDRDENLIGTLINL